MRTTMRQKLLGIVGLSALVAGCDPKQIKGPELTNAEDLRSTEIPPPPDGRASAVALLLIRENPLEIDGEHVNVPLTTFGAKLAENTRHTGCISAGCKALRDKYGHRPVPDSLDACTAAFIDERTILTAGHCITGVHWGNTYVVLGELPQANSGPSARLPVSQVARLECMHGAQYNQAIPDWAVVEVSPVGESLIDHATLVLQPHEPEAPIVVQSYMFRLPLQHEARRTTDPSRLRFTNTGGGSGAPLIQPGDRVVGVVSGNDTSGDRVCNEGSVDCAQFVTWSDHILEQRRDRPPVPRYDNFQPPICQPIEKSSP
jgi:hypothetical protein